MEGFDEVLGKGGEEDEFTGGDGSENFDAISESDSSDIIESNESRNSWKRVREGLESINSSTENHNIASNFPSEPSSRGSCLIRGCCSNNIDDDGSNANKQGRPAKPTAAQTGQKDRRERERDVKSHMTGYTTNQSAIKVNPLIWWRLN